MIPKYPTLDVYFHMTNHYKKLKHVKSVIDSGPPKGCDNGNRKKSSMRDGRQCTTPKYYAM